MAVTKMLSGICVAGFTRDTDPRTGLRWVRPVRSFGTLLPEDMCDEDHCLFACSDVVELNLVSRHPDPPHVEDWRIDLIHHRPRRLRRLEGERRARFFAQHLDSAPDDVLYQHKRSLCLVRPQRVRAQFTWDRYSGKYQAWMSVVLEGHAHPQAAGPRGIPVTDVRWRALGRVWLGSERTHLSFEHEALCEQLDAEELYLTLGLSRSWRGAWWPLVVGVHPVPDFQAMVDLDSL
jgi:hypothetical protein